MKSKEERRTLATERKARGDERMAAVKAKGQARQAEIKAKYRDRMESIATERDLTADTVPGQGPVELPYVPSNAAMIGAALVPGLSFLQGAKAARSQAKFMASLTPEQRMEYMRRYPGGYGGS